ncbi:MULTISPECIES: helix-turn-helix domain-containing protein [unclassified Mesorhizobium]|uniref:helix-turn-helix domain-containing protein n=1 Tax=unclassified Mesorhizobium TaxID=325217 RepID=UPI003334B39B
MNQRDNIASKDGTFVDAVRVGSGEAGRVVGISLKTLRQALGLTQLELAQRLGVGQAAVSKIEQRGDVQISSLQRYVEALGARLRIDAVFPAVSDALADTLRAYQDDHDQYVLPIFDDDLRSRRDLVLSIKPEYSKKILVGKKTVELRRRFPLATPRGTVAYIYSTSPVRALVGAAEIRGIERLPIKTLWQRHGRSASIRKADFDSYFGGLDEGYALTMVKPRLFSRPLDLAELRERFGFKAPQSFLYAKPSLQRALQNEPSNLSN